MKDVETLYGIELDRLVALAERIPETVYSGQVFNPRSFNKALCSIIEYDGPSLGTPRVIPFHPSTDWAHGGHVIEREKISLTCAVLNDEMWAAEIRGNRKVLDGNRVNAIYRCKGNTPLVAAMRCFVMSKLVG